MTKLLEPIVRTRNGLSFFQIRHLPNGEFENISKQPRLGDKEKAQKRGEITTVVLLPGCDAHPRELAPHNWSAIHPNIGRVRAVHVISNLLDGAPIQGGALVFKSPERTFDPTMGFRRNPKSDTLVSLTDARGRNLRIVERQAVLEAQTLQLAGKAGLPVEKPLAVVFGPQRKKGIVVRRINHFPSEQDPHSNESWAAASRFNRESTDKHLHPGDVLSHNVIKDRTGKYVLIDVARWRPTQKHVDNDAALSVSAYAKARALGLIK